MKCPRCGSPPPATLGDWGRMFLAFGAAYGACRLAVWLVAA